MTWATTVGVDGRQRRVTTWVMMWVMTWATTMTTLMAEDGGVDGRRQKRGHWWWCCSLLVWSWGISPTNIIGKLVTPLLTTFVMVSILKRVRLSYLQVGLMPTLTSPVTNVTGKCQRMREGTMAAVGRWGPPWFGCVFLPSFRLANCMPHVPQPQNHPKTNHCPTSCIRQ